MNIEVYHPQKDGEIKIWGTLSAIKFIFTPGHTKDGLCLLIENHLFSGDTLFAGSVGRTDLGNGNFNQLLNSIKNKILTLTKNTIIHPGHGPDTTVEKEIKYNPYLQ